MQSQAKQKVNMHMLHVRTCKRFDLENNNRHHCFNQWYNSFGSKL